MTMPSELPLGEVFVPPLLVVAVLSIMLAMLTTTLLNNLRLSRFFAAPSLVFVAIVAIYSVILGTFLIRI
jgi:hypothetical protein